MLWIEEVVDDDKVVDFSRSLSISNLLARLLLISGIDVWDNESSFLGDDMLLGEELLPLGEVEGTITVGVCLSEKSGCLGHPGVLLLLVGEDTLTKSLVLGIVLSGQHALVLGLHLLHENDVFWLKWHSLSVVFY